MATQLSVIIPQPDDDKGNTVDSKIVRFGPFQSKNMQSAISGGIPYKYSLSKDVITNGMYITNTISIPTGRKLTKKDR